VSNLPVTALMTELEITAFVEEGQLMSDQEEENPLVI
jgi:hypothetical protein